MLNPSYLIKSRHDVFYFRYPVENKRISISLKTRCPREALRLAKSLEYHSTVLMTRLDWDHMDHAEIMVIFKNHYARVLEQFKARIDRDGPLPKEKIDLIQTSIKDWDAVIAEGASDFAGLLGVSYEDPKDDPTQREIAEIMNSNGLSFDTDSKEYDMMTDAYKFAKRNCLKDILAYNTSVTDFSLLDKTPTNVITVKSVKPGHKLGTVIEAYLNEIKSGLSTRSYDEQRDCLGYLIDWLGMDYPISKLDDAKAREAKELLRGTPKGRNKSNLTAGKTLVEQLTIAKEHNLETLGSTSVNKYLAYFESLFNWAKRNRYIAENPFTGIRVKAEKKKTRRRELFTKEEIGVIINGLSDTKLVKNKSNYWGTLIAVYTGARRNEIAGLLPDDVRQDPATGIWYFDITDEEEEGKALKTQASKRVVPVHSRLIEMGFLEFLDESHKMKSSIKHEGGYEARLLYDLTYTPHEKWGRNLGRWFNEKYLKALDLKTNKKTLHSLRHSLITYLGTVGVEGANIKSIVGHEPDTVTTQVYTHYGVEHLPMFKEAIERLPY